MFVFYKLPFQYFLGLGCHIGSCFRFWSVETTPNVLFKALEYPIINLVSTGLNFISAIRFTKFCASRNLKPLFFLSKGAEIYLDFYYDGLYRFAYFLVHYWLPGFLSNFKYIFKKDKFNSISTDFLYVRRYPDFLVFMGITDRVQHLAASDSRSARIISIGLNDVDCGPAMFSYSIFSNSKSFLMAFNFYKLFIRAVLDGAKFFTLSIATFIFNFYKSYLTSFFLSPFATTVAKRFRASIFFYPMSPFRKFFKFYRPIKNRFITDPNLFLAQFSYSVLTKRFSRSCFFSKVVYSIRSGTIKLVSLAPSKFCIFRKLCSFNRYLPFTVFQNGHQGFLAFSRSKFKLIEYGRKRYPLPNPKLKHLKKLKWLNRLVVDTRTKKRVKKSVYYRNTFYTAGFLRSKFNSFVPRMPYTGLFILNFILD